MKKKLLSLIIILSTYQIAYSQVIQFDWAISAGGSENFDFGFDIVTDSNEDVIITGAFEDTATFDTITVIATGNASTGATDFFVAKYDSSGRIQWIKHTGGSPNQSAVNLGRGVAIDSHDNIVVVGEYTGSIPFETDTLPVGSNNEDIFLVKYDSDGNELWVQGITGITYGIWASSIVIDNKDNIYLTGYFGHHNLNGGINFGDTSFTSYGGGDIYIAKYDSDGVFQWARQAGSSSTGDRDTGHTIKLDESGNIIVTGYFIGTSTFSGNMISSSGSRDIFIAKYDSLGNVLWVERAGGSGSDIGYGLGVDQSGNIIVSGMFSGTATFDTATITSLGSNDMYLAKYDPNGNFLWVDRYGGDNVGGLSDIAFDVEMSPQDDIITTGIFSSNAIWGNDTLITSGAEDIFVTCYNNDGVLQWIKTAGGSEAATFSDRSYRVNYAASGSLYFTGSFTTAANFDTISLTAEGSTDLFIAKITPDHLLPTSLSSFSHNCFNGNLEVNWSALSTNLDYFIIEENGPNELFLNSYTISAKRESQNTLEYSFTIQNKFNDTESLAIYAVDQNGEKAYLGIQEINQDCKPIPVKVFPTYFHQELFISVPREIFTYSIRSITGQEVLSNGIQYSNSTKANLSSCTEGIYLVQIYDIYGRLITTKKIIKVS